MAKDGINVYNIGDYVDVPYLSDNVLHESMRGGFWPKMFRLNYVQGLGREEMPLISSAEKGKITFSGAPIEQFGEFEQGGLDKIKVPMKMRYRGMPRAGRAQLQGTGQGVDFYAREIPLYNYKNAFTLVVPFTPDGQVLRKAMEDAINGELRPAAAVWNRDYTDGDVMQMYLTGYSAHLTSLRSIVGARTDLVPHSHGNIFVAGHPGGRITHGITAAQRPGGAGYEERLRGAVNTALAASPSQTGMSAERLIAFRNDLHRLKVPPIAVPGLGDMYCIVMKDSQYTQLERDKELFRNDIIQSLPRDLKNNPFFGNVRAVFGQFVIYVYPDLWGIRVDGQNKVIADTKSSLGMPAYGPAGDWIQRSDTPGTSDENPACVAIAFGQGFASQAWGKVRMHWTMEKWDHEQNKEVGMFVFSSMVRHDVIDVYDKMGFGANAYGWNDTSALLITHSPVGGGY